MSKRNSQAAKTAARERLRIERERQAKRDKVKRQLIVAGSLVGVLAIAGGISYAVVQGNKPDHWEAAADAKLVKPANTSGENGTTVVIGKSDAKKTLELYEDPRCPVCATFEQTVGKTIEKDVEDGKYKIRFVGASFLDRNLTGEGSKNALSAMGAALNVSPEAFLAYKSALYSAEYHPEETDDKFKDDSYLIKIANTVDALKGNKEFQADVKDGTFDKWALEMSEVFDKSEAQGTPTLMMDGKKLTGSDGQNAPMTVAEFTTAVDKALKA
ncbi:MULTISPECIES: DsbA family protein [Streptomyces]|jgi:protein-disulfide isomerase|uniref:Disulfide bond formation protein DsbA n=2 Tax=Streptomyces TaxID=1883 RepID=A0A514K1G2_9ACTN|nr:MULTISPECIES: DsbA family protein [Streptomyces]MBA8943257.1 protein-disulfide isomerase [Streptomyces calvus]MBA8978952.1 protein-disulfide isomerase [Streptomyces calvus]MYS25757.1 thioredoxin domain-containing protein [Streptomyces sp. SID7804]QDI73469.1 disulfide bond formation protein DsbA [Streptomyces calvus]GGP36209.1 DSBA oxidoreductase [Streptomyces calvus]